MNTNQNPKAKRVSPFVFPFVFISLFLILTLALAGCLPADRNFGENQSPVETEESIESDFLETIEGENPDTETYVIEEEFSIIGNWIGCYSGFDRLMVNLSSDGKSSIQRGDWGDFLSPIYYGDYCLSEDGRKIILDMYQGVPYEIASGVDDPSWEWIDEGIDNAKARLSLNFNMYSGIARSFALKVETGGTDTEGYILVEDDSFIVFAQTAASESYHMFPFGVSMIATEDGKPNRVVNPTVFLETAEQYRIMAELDARCGPGDDYVSLGRIPPGTLVSKIAFMETEPENWAFVLFDNFSGWVNGDEFLN